MGTVKFEGPVLQVLVVTVAAIFLGGWWLIEKVVYREMDQRDDVIAKIEKSTFDNGEKIDELSAALANSIAELQAAVISELKEKHGNQEIQLVELKANYRSLSENVTRANSSTDKTIQEIKLEAKEARQKVDESLGVIREAEAVSKLLKRRIRKLT